MSGKVEQHYAPVGWDGGGDLLATVIRFGYDRDGLSFFSDPEEPQQLGYLNYPVGKVIDPHVHHDVARTIRRTTEVMVVLAGRIRVDLYTASGDFVTSLEIGKGDTISLVGGGHGFEILEPSQVVYVKQGPYLGDGDKARFFRGGV